MRPSQLVKLLIENIASLDQHKRTCYNIIQKLEAAGEPTDELWDQFEKALRYIDETVH